MYFAKSHGIACERRFCTDPDPRVTSTDPISGAYSHPRSSDSAIPSHKRPRKALNSRTQPVPKRVTKISINTPNPIRLVNMGDRAIPGQPRICYRSACPQPGNSRIRRSAPPASKDENSTEVDKSDPCRAVGIAVFFSSITIWRPIPTFGHISHRPDCRGSPDKPAVASISRSYLPARVQVIPRGRSASLTVRVHPSTCCCRSQTLDIYLASSEIRIVDPGIPRSRYSIFRSSLSLVGKNDQLDQGCRVERRLRLPTHFQTEIILFRR